jgi:hypothetical protein
MIWLVTVVFLLDTTGFWHLALAQCLQPAKSEQRKTVQLPHGATSNWLAQVKENIRQAEYNITWQTKTPLPDLKEAYHAPNRAQNLRTYFTPTGICMIQRTQNSSNWQWDLTLTGYGYTGAVKPVANAKLLTNENRIEYQRDSLTEWYVNDQKGLEQGFTLTAPPELPGRQEQAQIVLEMKVAGNLIGQLTDNGSAVKFSTSGGKEIINYGGLHINDASGRELAWQLSLENTQLAIMIHAADAVYPITIDPIITGPSPSPDWRVEGNQAGDYFGTSVSTAGDVNGDGYDDVIVATPYYDNGEDNEGAAFIYYGSATGLPAGPDWTAEGDQADAYFGIASTAGDINGDGYADVIIGAYKYDNGQTNEGAVFVYHGSASGLGPNGTPANADWTAESNQDNAYFGASVSTAGDVNGDGYDDIIVGAYAYDNGQASEGAAFVWHGSASGLGASGTPANADWTDEGDQAGAYFGYSVSTAGDVNGDGYADIIVGGHTYDNGQAEEGRVWVYHGSATGLPAGPNWTGESNQAGASLGVSVSTAGDVNGDGYDDIIVAASNYDNGEPNEGAAFVWHGSATGLGASGTPANADWTGEGNQAEAFFGRSVSTAGDINGDGCADVIVGAYGYDNGQTDEGAVFVYYGSRTTGLSDSPDWTAESNQESSWFGRCVSAAGDVNGDGYADVIVGAAYYDNSETNEGAAFVYYGSAAGPSAGHNWKIESNQAGATFGISVSTAGDVNGDGFADVIIGAYAYDNGQIDEGAAFVYYGSATGLPDSPDWMGECNQAGAHLGISVSTAGDVNGDGYADIIVGASWYSNGQTEEGAAFVWYGSATGLSASPDWSDESDNASAHFGRAVSTAGDVNGDGYSDVVIGAFWYDNGQTDEGAVFVYHGSATGLSASPDWTVESNQAGAYFGRAVSTAGDVNGDGYADIIVGADCYDNGQTDEGKVFVYYGSATGLSSSPDWTAESNQNGAHLGISVSTAGDVNGDGYADIIVGAYCYANGEISEGKAFVWYGSASGLGPSGTPANADWTDESNQASAYFGISVSTAGDVNGDGYADIIVGAYGYDNGQENEGAAFVYHGSATGLSASPNWTGESNHIGAYFGISVSTAGDVNGDGYADVIVGAYVYSNGQSQEGAAFVYYGSGNGLSIGPDWNVEGNQAGAFFGISVSTAGDVNGDGYADVIVGAYNYDNGQTDEGRVFVYHGSATGLWASPDWTAESNQANSLFGYSVSTAGDVNGDGYADIIVGAYTYDNGQTDEGAAFVWYGSASGLGPNGTPANADWTGESNQATAYFGRAVSTAGDVNGDGYADVIVGAYLYDNGEADEGAVFVYYGSATGLSASPDWTAESNQAIAYFGMSVSTAGDVNGDGYSDVIVGTYYYDNEGRAFVYYGSATGLSSSPDWTAESNQAGAHFGAVSTAGDVNGDGYADVIVGAYEYDNGQLIEGAAFVWYGSASGLGPNGTPANADWTAESNQAYACFGISVSTAGDVNGDGYADVIVGAYNYNNGQADEGAAFVYYGNKGSRLGLKPRQRRADNTAPIGRLGMSYSGDSFRLALLGRSHFGRGKVKLQWEVKPLGTPFDGTGTGQSAVWTNTGTAGVQLNELVSGLSPNTTYHWRARLLYNPATTPLQQYGRWMTMPWNGWQETDLRIKCPQFVLSADLYPDCCVNTYDLAVFASQWLESGDPENCPWSADLTGDDCHVDFLDFVILAGQWLQSGL